MDCSNMFSCVQAFHLVDRGSFRHLLKFCWPSLSERDIPHRQTLQDEILRHVHIAEGKVHENMQKITSKVSFTFNAWTSKPGDPYISLTAHYIDTPIDRPSMWELRSKQLLFQEIHGRHTGKNMGEILSRAMDQYELRGKVIFLAFLLFLSIIELLLFPQVGWFMSDGAAVNCTTLRVLQDSPSIETGWTVRDHDML
jgi:hypothetical protein